MIKSLNLNINLTGISLDELVNALKDISVLVEDGNKCWQVNGKTFSYQYKITREIESLAVHEHEIIKSRDNEMAIKCLICGIISFNGNDIKEKYCGSCHKFLK